MRVLIAGASGLIGTALGTRLRESGHDVRTLVRRQPGAPGEFTWDPPAGTLDAGAIESVDAVVNLCGSPMLSGRWSAARKQTIADSRLEPTDVLAEAVAEHGVGVFVNASGVGFYGDTGSTPVDESRPAGGGFLAGLCVDWERATEPANRAGARVVNLRTGLVLSGRGGLLGPLKPLFWLALGGKLGNGRQFMPWISLTDEVSAIVHALEHDAVTGPMNVCGPDPATNAEFTKAMGRALHRPAPWWVPAPALRLALGEAADEMALVSQRAVPRVLESTGFTFIHDTLDDALAAAL
ncbi:TIGR01777 family protein [Amycolatopsis antarctica]|uniref:TIGR01777 family protein n=1 Tax=Amycolatopsis antarctica TaxID=1854586 RepID=A0A263CY52_9PSEU|nr:TIGR01777 family oxidoreductase [Amycolatopsis antarctica]OZM70025.1 TIGR01777 family protein [Amycolatopsis antarctica]